MIDKVMLKALIKTKKALLSLPVLSAEQKESIRKLHNEIYKSFRNEPVNSFMNNLRAVIYAQQLIFIMQPKPKFENGGIIAEKEYRSQMVDFEDSALTYEQSDRLKKILKGE